MNLAETHRLLTAIAAIDNRRFDDATVILWRQILVDDAYDDCAQAATEHFRDEPDIYLMPGHIHRRAGQIAYRRAGKARAAQLAEAARLELPTGPTTDRSTEVADLLAHLRQRLGPSDPAVLRRREWVDRERQRQRAGRAATEPNPNYAGPPPPGGYPQPHPQDITDTA